jgi:hypothetical protein
LSITTHRRSFAVLVGLSLASLLLTSVALAARGHHNHARRTFAPLGITRAAEVSAVELDPLTQQFMQVTFDRGQVTAATSGSITLQQKQNGVVWRTQSFTVPSTAVVMLNGRPATLTQIPLGSSTRIESSGPAGGSVAVVRVNAYSHRSQAALPGSSS